ncbi:MAG: tagaturonate epimerase family protein [Candidatus Latescibacterota bacterium]
MRQLLKDIAQSGLLAGALSESQARQALPAKTGIAPASVCVSEGGVFALREGEDEARLVMFTRHPRALDGFDGESFSESYGGVSCYCLSGALNHANAVGLRKALPFTAPSVLEGRESFGVGDRIGGKAAATPAHIEAVRGSGLTPVLAQQSVRENQKTGRTFEEVLDDASWSVFREGYRLPWGSDADHLKTLEDVETAVSAGFTMFTIDPSEKIDYEADTDTDDDLGRKFDELFRTDGEKELFLGRYEGKHGATRRDVVRSAVKYLNAFRHAVSAYSRIGELRGGASFNFEMSIDETSTPTSPLDHRIIASEFREEGIRPFSIAPRFEGEFEKGIDYKGSLEGFRRSLEIHDRLSRELGNYRLSLHSGSDKFSIYPIFGEITDGFFHVKTAGTSYLEAVKAAAAVDMDLFGEIYSRSVATFAENVKSYHISANIENVPSFSSFTRDEVIRLITVDPDVRQTLHIAFGVILKEMGEELRTMLARNYDVYRRFLVGHIGKHASLLTGR